MKGWFSWYAVSEKLIWIIAVAARDCGRSTFHCAL